MEVALEDEIDFLDENEIRGRRLVRVANEIQKVKCGAAHQRNRRQGKGDAYCYKEEKIEIVQP